MRRFFLFFLLLTLSLALTSNAQESPTVKISTDKVKIDGNYYFVHIVQKGETLYSISRAYNVSQIEIAMENPDIYLGLQANQAIKIPIKDKHNKEIELGKDEEDFIYHVVRRRETLFGLAQRYQLTIEDIIDANPEVEEGLKVNQTIRIPKKRLQTLGDSKPEESEQFIYHEVKPREGFFSITRQYGVTEEDIRRYNEELVKDGIKLGTVLRIPKDPSKTDIDIEKTPTADWTTSLPKSEEHIIPAVKCDTFQYNRWRDVYNIALLLPFTIEISDSVTIENEEEGNDNNDTEKEKIRITPHTANFLDFYQGALIAIDSLKAQGFSVNLNVYNTGRNAEKVKDLTKEKGLLEANLIIGPAYPECLMPIANFALENRIPMVSPLSPNNFLLENNPYLFQANPSFSTQLYHFTKSIDFCNGNNIVIIHEQDSTNLAMINVLKELISQRFTHCQSPETMHFKEVTYQVGSAAPDVQERISHSLSHNRENMIIIPSNNEAFVSGLLGNLNTLSNIFKYPISIYGYPRWQRFRNVQIEYYYQLQLHLFSPFFIDYSSPLVKSFITRYRDSYRSEPSQYSYQGYDVVFYFLSAMKTYGEDFQFCIHNHEVDLLQSHYNFKKINGLSGFENQSVFMLKYNENFEITRSMCIEKKRVTTSPLKYFEESGRDRTEALIIE